MNNEMEITIKLKLNEGTCKTVFCNTGEEVIAKIKADKESGQDFDIDSYNAVEKGFLCILNALYGLSMIGNFEEE